MSRDLLLLDAVGQAELVARKEVSALELVDAAIARIESVEPKVHALASTDFEGARKRATRDLSGPLAGVPFLIKDLLAFPGQRLAMGSRLFRDNIAQTGSPYSERLDAAGLISLGKTTTSEFGLLGSTETALSGITRNPWDLQKSAMGSSGGSAAAVASAMVSLAHASDGGGSIRIPASACGLFGFKPSRGRCVSNGQPDPQGLIIEHCVTRSVRDSALFLSLTEDLTGQIYPPVGYVRDPLDRPLRIGVYDQTLMGRSPDPEVARALALTATLARELGHEVIPASPPPIEGSVVSQAFFTWAGASMQGLRNMMAQALGRPIGANDLEPFTLALIEWYEHLPEGAMGRAQASLARVAKELVAYLAQYDVVLCPTIPIEPWNIGSLSPDLDRALLIERTEVLAGYTPVHNMAGAPAMSVPLFTSTRGLPIGSHFAASPGQDAVLLALAYQLEAAVPWRDRWPATSARLAASLTPNAV